MRKWHPPAAALAALVALLFGSSLNIASGTAQATATTSWKPACVAPYTISKPPPVSETASTAIGQVLRASTYKQYPTWREYKDKLNTGLYDKLDGNDYFAGLAPGYVWNSKTYVRQNVFAINAKTGAPTSFAPKVDGEVLGMALSCTGSDLYLVGNFHHVNGLVRNYAAKIVISTGSVASWNPNPNGLVRDISIMHDHLVMDGDFTSVGGVARSYVTSLGQTTATPDSWLNILVSGGEPTGISTKVYPRVDKVVSSPNGTFAPMIGNFNDVGGVAHRRIALLDLTGSTVRVLPWNTRYTDAGANRNSNLGGDCSAGFAAPELDIVFTPGGTRWFTVDTGGPHSSPTGVLCDAVSKWDSADIRDTNAKPMEQQFLGGDTASAAVCSSLSCFISGHMRRGDDKPTLGECVPCPDADKSACPSGQGDAGYDCPGPVSVNRPGILEVSLGSMQATNWSDPNRSRQEAMHNAMFWTPYGLAVGSDGNHPRNDLVVYPFTR